MIRIYIALFIAGIILAIGIESYFEHAFQNKVKAQGERSLEKMHSIYDAVIDTYMVAAQKDYHSLMSNTQVMKLLQTFKYADSDLKNIIRGRIYRLMHQQYEQMRALHVRQFHMHTHQGTSLLRFHIPYVSGDPLIDLRTSVRIANTKFKTVTGFEGGKIYPGYRYLFPIIFEGDHLGSVEFSISFEGIEDKLKSLMPESSFQLMMTKESTIDRVFEWHYSFFQQSDWHENYFVEAPSLSSVNQDIEANSRIQLLLKQVKESPVLKRAIEDKESFSFFTIDRGNGYFINFLEFKNTDNKHAGYILSYTKHNAIIALEGEYRLYKLLTIFSLFVVLFLLAIVLKQMASAKAYHIKLERFIDLQSSIVILSNGKKFTFANRSFYDFFGFKDLEAFKQKYDCICECFVVNDHFFSLDKVKEDEEQWVESLLNIPARKRIVSMIDQTKVAHAFSVGINTFDEQFYVVNFTDISDTMIEKLQLEKQATRDELTNAYNRAYFKNSIKTIRSSYEDQKLDTGLIFFDIDHFKKINDTYGHDIGDSVLKELVKRVQSKLRASDHLVRWGGEEFIVAVGSDSLESVAKVAEHLRHDIESFSFANVEKVTCSFGVAIGSSDTPIESIISDADKKLYEAKAAGRNQVQK